LIIFANWRGFSGGLRDLFEEILKFGSYIVDNLREYKQPVFVYIPPCGELRGGAWAVLDPTINPEKMEMYCDENGRGGVLEPNGTVEIKYKAKDILKTMHRLDDTLLALTQKLKSAAKDDILQLNQQIEAREKQLMSIYEQVATNFADLHDTPGRMKAKGCIHEVVAWQTSRQYFYYRVKRRILEEYLKRSILKLNSNYTNDEMIKLIRSWVEPANDNNKHWQDDKFVGQWLQTEQTLIQQKLKSIREQAIQDQVSKLATEDASATLEGLLQVLNQLPADQKANILTKLKSLK